MGARSRRERAPRGRSGQSKSQTRGATDAPRPDDPSVDAEAPAPPELHLKLIWGDIVAVEAHAYAVGHYADVLPASAERAVDAAVSGAGYDDVDRHVLRRQTEMGLIRGAVGDVDLFPWPPGGDNRVALVAGMGAPGTFGPRQLVTVVGNIVAVAASLPGVESLAMVMIGSGAANMTVGQTIEALLRGFGTAARAGDLGGKLRLVTLVERDLGRARRMARNLAHAAEAGGEQDITLRFGDLEAGTPPGTISLEHALALTLGGFSALDEHDEEARRRVLEAAAATELDLGVSPADLQDRLATLPERLAPAAPSGAAAGGTGTGAGGIATSLVVGIGDSGDRSARNPTRISYLLEDGEVVASAIGDAATIAKRPLGLDGALLDEVVSQTYQPASDADLADATEQVTQLLVPPDLRPLLRTAPQVVFEVDRRTAAVPWELASGDTGPARAGTTLGLQAEVSRQLRTEYSPPPVPAVPAGTAIRVLVVGDPGDPRAGHDLPGARREALAVHDLLAGRDGKGVSVQVELLLGPPGEGNGGEAGARPASRYEVIRLLRSTAYDIVHFCGHGAFEADDPGRRAGWVFADGLLTARQLELVYRPPRLVVANACHSGRLSRAGGGPSDRSPVDRQLLPALVDELLHQGVRDHIGAAWEVDDEAAITFATTLYDCLLGGDAVGATLGEAVLAARRAVAELGEPSWAAYQHYGYPTTRLVAGPDAS